MAAVERLARSDPRLARAAGDFDGDLELLNTPGGVVDLATGGLLPHDPSLLCTRITAVEPAPADGSPARTLPRSPGMARAEPNPMPTRNRRGAPGALTVWVRGKSFSTSWQIRSARLGAERRKPSIFGSGSIGPATCRTLRQREGDCRGRSAFPLSFEGTHPPRAVPDSVDKDHRQPRTLAL